MAETISNQDALDMIATGHAALVANLAEPPALTPTENLATFSERGITWNLAAAAPVGKFISGDYFAVGGVVTSTVPASVQDDGTYNDAQTYTARWVHGLMVNPGSEGGSGANPSITPQGFDSLQKSPAYAPSVTEFAYDHALNLDPGATGLSLSGVKSLVKTKSILDGVDASSRAKLENVSLLTILDATPPDGAFRRWAGCASKTPIFFASDIDWTVLPSIAKPAAATTLTAADLIAKLGPLQTYMNQQLYARGIAPYLAQQAYGADIANDISQAMLFTMTAGTSTADRNAVAYRLIQAGLDVYDATEAGRRWSSATFSFGGAHQWLKILLVYAARLLRNAANVTERNKLAAWCDGGAARIFAEDMCTFSITREMIESMPYEPINTRLAPVGYPDWSENSVDWLAKPSNLASCGLAYELAYRTVNSYPWLSQVLVARLLGAETMWNNPKFFEYCDTYYNKWVYRGRATDPYFYAYNRFMVWDHYETYAPAFSDATAPTLVRRAANARYAWIEFNEPFSLLAQPAAADFAVTVDGAGVSLASVSTTATGVKSSGSTNMSSPLITVASAAGIRIGQRVECGSLAADTFVTSVNGLSIGISSLIANAFSAQPITFHNVFAYNRTLVAVLPAPLTTDTQPVTIGYTTPGAGYVHNLGGVAPATVAVGAATNNTGKLPAGPISKDLAYSGAVKADRQFSGGGTPRSQTLNRWRFSVRFMLKSKMAANENIVSVSTGSTATFRVYAASTQALRVTFGGSVGQSIRAPYLLDDLPVGKVITMHMMFDGSALTQTTAKRLAVYWEDGGYEVDISSSTGTLDGTWVGQMTTMFANGFFAFANGSGNDAFHGAISEITLGWGDNTLPLPANLTGPQFAYNADWGPTGAGPWGQNQWYFAGTLEEWNTGMPNRGDYGSYALTPRRYAIPGDPDSGLATLFTAPPA